MAMGRSPENRVSLPGRIVNALHRTAPDNPLQKQVDSLLSTSHGSVNSQPPITRETIEVPGLPPVSKDSSLGRVLGPLVASGGQANITDELSATGLREEELQRVADTYKGVFKVDREAGIVSSPPIIEAQRNRDPQAA